MAGFDGFKAVDDIAQSVLRFKSARESRQAADKTKRFARLQTSLINAQAKQAAAQVEEETRRTVGDQKAAFGAAGVEGSGTSQLVAIQSLFSSIVDQERILTGAKIRAHGINEQARNTSRGLRQKAFGENLSGVVKFLGFFNNPGLKGEKKKGTT